MPLMSEPVGKLVRSGVVYDPDGRLNVMVETRSQAMVDPRQAELRPWNVRPGDVVVAPDMTRPGLDTVLRPYVVHSVVRERMLFSAIRSWSIHYVTGYAQSTGDPRTERMRVYRDERVTVYRERTP